MYFSKYDGHKYDQCRYLDYSDIVLHSIICISKSYDPASFKLLMVMMSTLLNNLSSCRYWANSRTVPAISDFPPLIIITLLVSLPVFPFAVGVFQGKIPSTTNGHPLAYRTQSDLKTMPMDTTGFYYTPPQTTGWLFHCFPFPVYFSEAGYCKPFH